MKTRILYLMLIGSMLLSACSGGAVTTSSTVTTPAVQAISASTAVTPSSSSRTKTTATTGVATPPTVKAPAAQAISASASVEADVYFCPEHRGTYFGSFYLKDIPAMSDSTYAIPTNLTGDMGENMLKTLTSDQAQLITGLVDIQKPSLQGIVDTRRQISTELRKFKDGSAVDEAAVLSLMEKYGAYDGEIIYNLAVHFAEVGHSLTDDQKTQLLALRKEMLGDLTYPSGAYLYSQPIAMPEIPNTDFPFT
jgi:hypothetical protein